MDKDKCALVGKAATDALKRLGARTAIVIVEGDFDDSHNAVGIFGVMSGNVHQVATMLCSFVTNVIQDAQRHLTPQAYQEFLAIVRANLSGLNDAQDSYEPAINTPYTSKTLH